MDRINIPPIIGPTVLNIIEQSNGGQTCHIVLITLPVDTDGKLGQPAFLTSLLPEEMQDVLIQIAGGFALAGKPIVSEH